jgi:hypothetical protein
MEATHTTQEGTATAKESAAPSVQTRRVIKQIVVREFGDVGKYRVRLVRASSKPEAASFLDVREYVRGANYEGFTRKGVRLGFAEARQLRGILEGLEQEGALS